MFDFIDKLRGRRAERAATDFDVYRELILRGAQAGGTLNASDTAKLEKVADSLGYGLERIEGDTAAAARLAELTAAPVDVESARLAMKAVTRALGELDVDTTRQIEDVQAAARARRKELESAKTVAWQAWRDAAAAGNEVAALKADHWRLFGEPQPPTAAAADRPTEPTGPIVNDVTLLDPGTPEPEHGNNVPLPGLT